ncbi:MAG: hypothetical protein B7X04_04195 [Parcubacteria group bacterium 21-54-25]|nr:MAG: hypothetical protein B7X04_04195 [Parcubacteria group bacterium 21-54-25]HQU08236.1 DEAD/DEAH box helicase [Candidatus Paceibacterota bacterium]
MYQKQSTRRDGRYPFSKSHSGSAPGFSRARLNTRGRTRPSAARGHGGSYIDPSKFINKAVITEEAEHFVPEHQFTDFALVESLKKNVVAKGYVTPTPIQDRVIPHILAGQDVVGIANTGTGKTAAFLLPLIDKVLRAPRTEQVLVVVPTRELALQIEKELVSFTKGMKLFSVCCVGGAPIRTQLRSLRYWNHFIVGTPGRLKDLIDRGSIRPATCNTIVLDEADQMLDMGFVNDMRFIMEKMPSKRHTLFFSATMSPQIEGLVREFLREPVRISVKTSDTPTSIDQDVVRVTRGTDKFDVLRDLLNQKDFSKVLVFARTKHGAERLAKQLAARGLKADSIHGNKSQPQRQRALANFSNERVQVLVATDVAARGLDISNVSHVINYDIPATYDDYVHRIGRTGRGNKRGKALTFLG